MKKVLLVAGALLTAGLMNVQAQEIFGGTPYSYTHNLSDQDVSKYVLPSLDMAQVEAEDMSRDIDGHIPLFSRLLPVTLNLNNSGEWTQLPNGDRLWKLKLEGRGAKALSLGFDAFEIPEGASLHVYNVDRTEHFGAFNHLSNKEGGKYAIPPVRGEVIVMEYFEPASLAGQGVIQLEWVGHAYRHIKSIAEEQAELDAERADPCQVDIRCSEGAPFWDEKRGVVRIIVVSTQGQGFCSGSLVNNTNEDCKPYILTALHCAVGGTPQYSQWSFTFNYERSQCGAGIAPNNQFLAGCTRRADSNDGGGNNGSDFLLVECDDQVPDNYDAYFNGWDASTTAASSGVSIHHPAGDSKKISTYTNNLVSASWGTFGTHWRVVWTGTTNGHGVTEGGSSGSPIFNEGPSPKIVGTLTGGSSYCNEIQPGGQNQPDFYGKMDHHWTDNPNSGAQKLSAWLDPANSGVTEMEGSFDPCGIYTGMEEEELFDRVKLYPNPNNGQFTINVELENRDDLLVEVFNATGGLVYTEAPTVAGNYVVDLGEEAKGIYFVNITTQDAQISKKMIVQ